MDAVLYSACIFSLVLSNLIVLDGINKTLYTLIFSLHMHGLLTLCLSARLAQSHVYARGFMGV